MDSERATCILIASDDAATRERLAEELGALGREVAQVEDQTGLRAELERRDVELIVLDAHLPGGDLLGLCRELWDAAHGSPAPVVLLVQPDDVITHDTTVGTGVADFLQHPVHAALLRHVVERGLARPTTTQPGFPVRVVNGTLDDLLAFVAAQMPVARRESKHLAVLYLDVRDDSSGSAWDQLDEQSTGELLAFMDDCFQGVYEPQEDRESLLAPRAGICSVCTGPTRFVVAVPEMDRVQDAVRVASRLHERLSRKTHIAGRDVTLTASIGIAAYPEDGSDPRGLVALACHLLGLGRCRLRQQRGGRRGAVQLCRP